MYTDLPRLLRGHVRIFQYLGSFDASLHVNREIRRRSERRLIAWTSLLLATFLCTTLNTFLQKEKFLFTNDRFGYFNDALKVIIAQINIIVIHLETIFRRDAVYKFWWLYVSLQASGTSAFCPKPGFFSQLRKHCRFMLIFYGINAVELSVELVFLIKQEKKPNTMNFWSYFTLYVYMAHLRNMQFIAHIELMRQELVRLQHGLALLAEYTSLARRAGVADGFEQFLREKLVEKQKIYQKIYEMFESFQQAFGLSIIVVLLMFYVRVLVGSYFIYYTQYHGGYEYENLLMLPSLFEIPVFLITSKCCMDVVKHITYHLHSIQSHVNHTLVSVQIHNFSLQILHQKIKIDGLGTASLDCYMLSKAVGSILTYMIFFVQFMPKFRA